MKLTAASNLAFGLALVGYLTAAFAYFHHLAYGRGGSLTTGRVLAFAGAGAHLTSIVLRGMAAERVPWGNMYEYASVVGFLVVAGYLLVERLTRVRLVGGFVLATTVLIMGGATLIYVPPGPLVPALNSYWIMIHVVAISFGSALFILGFVFTVLYLIRDAGERRDAKRAVPAQAPAMAAVGAGLPHDFVAGADEAVESPVVEEPTRERRRRLPASEVLDRLAYRTIAFGFPIWTFAVIAGAIWAEDAWGRYWAWDPKEVWSFVTWVVFAAYLHARATAGWRGRRAAIIAVAGFVALAFNLVVVNLVISGLHSYAGT